MHHFFLSEIVHPSTGHLLIFKSQIVYLDFSPTSLATAKARAEARNLKNIRWVVQIVILILILDFIITAIMLIDHKDYFS